MRLASLDMYRKVPIDLLEGTQQGSILSLLTLFIITILFLFETKEFVTTTTIRDLKLDRNNYDTHIRVNFNITLMDLPCDYAVIDVVDAWNGEEQNITQNVNKFSVDAEGMKRRYHGRNKGQRDIMLRDESVQETLEELEAGGVNAVSLDKGGLEEVLKEYRFVFVDFYAMWCSHCRLLMPTWEALADVMFDSAASNIKGYRKSRNEPYNSGDFESALKVELPVFIAKVDCIENAALCKDMGIKAYPTIQLFVNGEKYKSEYRGDRTVIGFTTFLAEVEKELLVEGAAGAIDQAKEMAKDRLRSKGEQFEHILQRSLRRQRSWSQEDHPGCQLSGFLVLNRAPGNFHIEARSSSKDIVPNMANLSHVVHSLSFGIPSSQILIERGVTSAPRDLAQELHPMDDNVYITDRNHEVYHHHLKLITHSFSYKKMVHRAYQYLYSSHISLYDNDVIPEAVFSYDLSPVAIYYSKRRRGWYRYCTSLMAIIGGTFTVLGLTERFMSVVRRRAVKEVKKIVEHVHAT